jgi:hypothetical protein
MADTAKKGTSEPKPSHDAAAARPAHHPVALVIMIGKRLTPSAKRRLTGGR